MVVPFTEELTVMPVAFPKTYILPGQPNFKDAEECEYLFQSSGVKPICHHSVLPGMEANLLHGTIHKLCRS